MLTPGEKYGAIQLLLCGVLFRSHWKLAPAKVTPQCCGAIPGHLDRVDKLVISPLVQVTILSRLPLLTVVDRLDAP